MDTRNPDISNPHNLIAPPPPESALRYGIRVTLRASDPFRRLLDAGWHREHWFATPRERDEALADMAHRHAYSRNGDVPTPILEAIER